MAMTPEEERVFELGRIEKAFSDCNKPVLTDNISVDEFKLKMDDGIGLKMIVYRPDLEGPLPTIAVRTCYPDSDYITRATALEYARRGFNYCIQYCRGSGESEGEWEPNVNERADGKKFIDWVAAQDWVKCIGYAGCSYLSLTGWVISDILPEKVKTMYLTHYGAHRHVSAYKDGLFRHDVLTGWAMGNAGFPVTADYIESCKFRPHVEVDEKLWGKRVDWYRKWVTLTDADDEYWNTGFWGLLKEIPSRVTLPIYFGEGWYDHHLGSAIETWKSLSDECKKHSKFLVGDWDHGFNVADENHIRTGKDFRNDDILRTFNWMYDILVDGKEPEGSVDTYIIGDDMWYSRPEYEISGQKEKRFFLNVNESGRGISAAPSPDEAVVEYAYDPEDPTPTIGAESCLCTPELKGSLTQPGPDWRSDVVSFVSEPLEEDFTVLGTIRVQLSVATDCEDTAFAAKLCEITPDGKAFNVRTGITTLGYRNGSSHRISYTPGEEVPVSIDMWDIAYKFPKGSRIRLDIASADFPQYAAHSNTPGCWALADKTKIAHQKVFVGGEKSCIVFPLIPEE